MTAAGDLREKITFAQREDLSANSPAGDDYGGVMGDFVDRFTVRARVRPLKGGEDVMQSRLAGKQPVIITVRQSSDTLQIGADWRATDARDGTVYAITAPPANTDERNKFLDILAVVGEAA